MENKKGELATQQIVLLIVLIASFAILLLFLFRLNLGETTEKEICHNSVVTKASSALPTGSVPLNCQRSYLCITKDNSCEKMTKPDKIKVKTEEEVYSVLASEMADCWWMFGQGELEYVKKDLTSNLYCSVCSQIAFDDSVNDIFPDGFIYEELLYYYLEKNDVPNLDETYLEYFYKTNDFGTIKTNLENSGVQFGEINLDKQYYVMMGITSEVSAVNWAIGVGVGALALTFLAPAAITGGAFALGTISGVVAGGGGAGIGTAVGIFVQGLSGNDYLSPSIIEANSEEFEALGCESIVTLS